MATTGTGTLALDGPVAGFCSFAEMAEGAQVPYRVQIGAVYEVGLGTVLEDASETGYELTRDIVLMASGHDGYLDGNSIDLTASSGARCCCRREPTTFNPLTFGGKGKWW